MFECLLLPWQQICHLAFYSIFRTAPEVFSKLYFAEICQVSEKLWLFSHKRADFWLLNFEFKRSLLSLLKSGVSYSSTVSLPRNQEQPTPLLRQLEFGVNGGIYLNRITTVPRANVSKHDLK